MIAEAGAGMSSEMSSNMFTMVFSVSKVISPADRDEDAMARSGCGGIEGEQSRMQSL